MPSYTIDRTTLGSCRLGNGTFISSKRSRLLVERTTAVTDKYHSLVAQKKFIPPKPYKLRRREWEFPRGFFVDRLVKDTDGSGPLVRGSVSNSWDGDVWNPIGSNYIGDIAVLYPTSAQKQRWDSQITADLLAEIKGQRIQLGTAFAERKQTVDFIESAAKTVFEVISALLRRDLGGFFKGLGYRKPTRKEMKRFITDCRVNGNFQGAANAWLAYSYAWKPLLGDVYAAMDVFSEDNFSDRFAGYVRKGKPLILNDRVQSAGFYISSTTNLNFAGKRTFGVYYDLDESAKSAFVRTLQEVGLSNPLELAWELLPFSFVVDWFLPIGSYLSSLDATFGCYFKGGYRSDKWTVTSERVAIGTGKEGARVWTEGSSSDSYKETWFDRFPLTDFPSPVFPSLKDPLSVNHALSAISLITTLFLRK